MKTESWKSRETEKIIADIRSEVGAQKACIAQYTFHAIGLVGVVWGLIFKVYSDKSPIAFYICGSIVVFLVLAVVRMANHKYLTINRNLGYELHLNRLKDYAAAVNGNSAWCDKMLEIGWEEAMCAWRVSQATIYKYIYESSNFMREHRMKKEHRKAHPYQWFCTDTLLSRGTAYQAGNYLRNVHWMLHAVGGFSLAIMIWFFVAQTLGPGSAKPRSAFDFLNLISPAVIIAVISIYFIAQINRQGSYRRILESEMLSIQSSAVMWRIVITCHILAVASAFKWHNSYMYHTRYCSCLAADFNRHFYEPHNWLSKWQRLGMPPTEATFRELAKISPQQADCQEIVADAVPEPGLPPNVVTIVDNTEQAVVSRVEGPTKIPATPSPTDSVKAETVAEDGRDYVD